MRKLLLIPLLMVLPLTARGKGEDTSVWKHFELIASKGNLHTGTQRLNIPREPASSLADMLSRYSALFVKYYGPGSLASTSMRGLGAQHTAVLWNGVNLQSAMNSNFDLNLLPSFFIDKAAVETGAGSAACGSGSLAGAIVLQNHLPSVSKVYSESALGSFGKKELGAGFSIGKGRFRSGTRLVYRRAENDFEYANVFVPGSPTEKMSNNRLLQTGLMQEFSLQPGKRHQLYANLLFLNTERQLAPVMGSASDMKERQNDANRVFLVRHEGQLGKAYKISNRLVYLLEKIDYFNAFLQPAYNRSRSLMAESELKRQLGSFELSAGLNSNYQRAETDGYRNGRSRLISAALLSARWTSPAQKTRLFVSVRQMLQDGRLLPFMPEIGAEFKVAKKWLLKSNASTSYRIPSFNDLYWLPGGNPQLKPESGRKLELSTEFRLSRLKAGLSVFRHRVENWILWQPLAGASGWMATNARQVDSRGLELALDSRFKTGLHAQLRLFGRYQYVKSINTLVYGNDLNALGKMLIYTPKYTAAFNLQYIWKAYRLQTGAVYTGSRYTNAANSAAQQLPGFAVLNLSCSRELQLARVNAVLDFSVLNLLNSTYTVFENRPMPLRNYQLSLKFTLQNDK